MSDAAGTETNPILIERRGKAAVMTLNRPAAMNALSRPLVAAARAVIADVRSAPDVRALVIRGAGGKAFCAGADLRERRGMSLDDTRAYVNNLNALFDEVAGFPHPVIAAIEGVAFGGGMELALACDLRLATDGVEMGLLEVRVGILPGAGGTQRLPRLIGVALAKELILTGRRIDAARAREVGLVSEVVAPGAMDAAVDRWVGEIAAAAPLAVAQAKRAIDGGMGLPLAQGQAIERAAYEVVLTSEDRNEGLAAFADKRPPVWKGR